MENQRIRLTKTLFHQALVECLQNKDISQISVREVCQQAQLNRSTFYLHYQDIYDLLEEIQQELIQQVKKSISIHADTIQAYLDYIKENRKTYIVLLQNPSMEEFNRQFSEAILKETIKESLLDETNPFVLYAYSFVVDGSIGAIREWINNGCVEDTKQFAKFLYQICVDAQKRYEKSRYSK